MKKINLLLLFIGLFFVLFQVYKIVKPRYYHYYFNDQRKEIGLEPIKKDWKRHYSKKAVYQKWTPKEINPPCFLAKYVNCDSPLRNLKAEDDNYIIFRDSVKEILSVYYSNINNDQQKLIFNLKEVEVDSLMGEVSDLFGYPSEIIKSLTAEEANQLMKENNIKKSWQ